MMKTKGQCAGCKGVFSSSKGGQHLTSCSKIALFLQESPPLTSGYLLKVSSADAPQLFWMFLTIPSSATLDALDLFLRDIWLECCGHMSIFTINKQRYSSYQDEGRYSSTNMRVGTLFTPGLDFDYVYDLGSSTYLKIKVVEEIEQCPKKKILLAMRNDMPLFECESCKNIPDSICSFCGSTICQSCRGSHACVKRENDTYMLLPLVNSPRAGLCGYCGRA